MENTNPNRRSIEKDRFINSSPQRVFQALTEKAELERWFARTADIDLRPGGEVSFEWDRAKGVFEHGKVLIVEPPTQFSCTWEAMEPSPTTLTFTLSAHDGGTRLQFLHMGMGKGSYGKRMLPSATMAGICICNISQTGWKPAPAPLQDPSPARTHGNRDRQRRDDGR